MWLGVPGPGPGPLDLGFLSFSAGVLGMSYSLQAPFFSGEDLLSIRHFPQIYNFLLLFFRGLSFPDYQGDSKRPVHFLGEDPG